MKKAGIVTLVGRFNYGNRLQNYAVDFLLRSRGLAVDTFVFPMTFAGKTKHLIKKILGMPTGPESRMSTARSERFARFDERMSQRRLCARRVPSGYDVYAVGSDQIWNPSFYPSARIAFLQDVSIQKRVALCPSFGVSSLDALAMGQAEEGLAGFCRLSVREESGAALIRQVAGKSAEVLVDPTLAVPVEHWDGLASDEVTPDEDFIFIYGLGDDSEERGRVLQQVSDYTEISKVVYLSDRSKEGEVDAGPEEYIGLIRSAKHVVTNSFHGAVFSILFQTPLTVFCRVEQESTLSRIETLLSTFNLENKLYGSDHFDLQESGNYQGCVEIIEGKREEFLRFMDDELERSLSA